MMMSSKQQYFCEHYDPWRTTRTITIQYGILDLASWGIAGSEVPMEQFGFGGLIRDTFDSFAWQIKSLKFWWSRHFRTYVLHGLYEWKELIMPVGADLL